MASTHLFISDLHLGPGVPQRVQGFIDFLASLGSEIKTLYILGDLFDSYIGDDDEAGIVLAVRNALGSLALRGVAIRFQQGNRDFLLGEYFLQKAGAVLLDDYALIHEGGRHVLLTHGDLLCTDDVQYQSVRQLLRSADWQRNALAKPLWARRLYARWYRLRSFFSKARKTGEIMDVNPLKVQEVMRSYQVCTLVHGHTHRPDLHEVDLGHGIQGERWVLAEWKDDGEYLLLDHAGFRRVAVTW